MSKLTLDDIQRTIVLADYYVFPGTTMTVCCLTLQHGFNVVGTSACIDNTEFDPQIGKTIALNNAIDKIWELEGYLTMFKGAKGLLPQDAVAALDIPVIIPEQPAPQELHPDAPSAPAPAEVTVPDGTDLPDPVVAAPTEAAGAEDAAAPAAPATDDTGMTITQGPAVVQVDPSPDSASPTDGPQTTDSGSAPASDQVSTTDAPQPQWFPFSKPATELTAEQLVVEEQAEVAREAAEDQREAAWKAQQHADTITSADVGDLSSVLTPPPAA